MPEVTTVLSLELTIRDLRDDDLPAWPGSPRHVASLARQFDRTRAGTMDYLVACLPSGASVGKCGIDYETRPGAGTMTQLDVRGELQSCGIGTALIRASEDWIRARGLCTAEIAVEVDNPRAQALYERLGYVAYGSEPASWEQDGPEGSVVRYETVCVQLRRTLD